MTESFQAEHGRAQETSRQRLSAATAVAIIVGIVVGAGIFKTPSMVAGVSGDAGWMMLAWLAGAVISVAGALCYAELSSKHAHAGGDYHFLELAYGRNLSFLYAWAKATVINTGSIALLAFVFGDYMSKAIPLGSHSSALWAIGVVVMLTLINWLGIQASGRVQSVLTVIEVTGLIAVVFAGFSIHNPSTETPAWFSSSPPLGLAGLALVFVLLTFGGWNESAFISSEVKGGPRVMVWVILLSLFLITLIYILVNLALLNGLGLGGLAKSKAAAADVMQIAFGDIGQQALSLFVAIAALTSINATMIVGARSNFALASSWKTLSSFSAWNEHTGTPIAAMLLQSSIALALIVFGLFQHDGFEAMVEFTAPVFWSFLFLVGLSVFKLRHAEGAKARIATHTDASLPIAKGNHPDQEAYRLPLYPITPLVFCASCAYLSYSSLTYAASKDAVHISLSVMGLGLLALLLLQWRERSSN